MNMITLAEGYPEKATKRLRVLDVLLEEEAFSQEISKRLRRERVFAFYGDVDFIPTDEYTRQDALQAIDDANYTLDNARLLIKRTPEPAAKP